MTKNTPIILDRLASALSRHGVKLKRTHLLQSVASAFGYRNTHELTAADEAGELAVPQARYLGRTRVSNVGWMHFFQEPGGAVFGVDQDRFDAQEGRAADWLVSPFGGLLDVSALRRPQTAQPVETYLGQPVPKFTNLCEEITLPSGGVMPLDPTVPHYMTNACCEAASVTREDLERLQLAYGSFNGEFYPLTDAEALYIAEDVVDAEDGLHGAMTGYSVLFDGAKHLMPTVEMPYAAPGDAEGEFPPRHQVIGDATSYADRIRGKVQGLGGDVLVEDDGRDRVLVQILVPLAQVMAAGDPDRWRRTLAWLLVDPDLPNVLEGEIVHTGREYRVTLSWLGEGLSGDYDPEIPDDVPLVRFDVDRLVDGEWQAEEDGSYCTQVPAWAPREKLQETARHLVDVLEIEGGAHNKRLMERMSWVGLDEVEAARQERVAAEALLSDTYVAHVTYGDPDNGTSIDLRRRADGSVRCEVYVDLTSAAALEAGDIDEVRAWLKTLPCDIENADGPALPSFALAPQWFEGGPMSVRWMLVHAGENEVDWFADTGPEAPFERRFVRIDEMTV